MRMVEEAIPLGTVVTSVIPGACGCTSYADTVTGYLPSAGTRGDTPKSSEMYVVSAYTELTGVWLIFRV